MSNVIQFLEALGSRPLNAAEYGAAVAALDVEDGERQALFGRNHGVLSDLLGGRAKMYCAIVAPDEDEPEVPEDEPEVAEGAPDEQQPGE